jgi:hypothetical protein
MKLIFKTENPGPNLNDFCSSYIHVQIIIEKCSFILLTYSGNQ